jgi:hypothetical protein
MEILQLSVLPCLTTCGFFVLYCNTAITRTNKILNLHFYAQSIFARYLMLLVNEGGRVRIQIILLLLSILTGTCSVVQISLHGQETVCQQGKNDAPIHHTVLL